MNEWSHAVHIVLETGKQAAEEEDNNVEIPCTSLECGLTQAQVDQTRATNGFNEIPKVESRAIFRFLKKFVGLSPIILEVTLIASLAIQSWILAGVVGALLIFNAVIGFIQESRAAKALDTLQESLQITTRCLRDSQWKMLPSRELAVGDVVRMRQGDLVPADVVLTSDAENFFVDQSALTGESNEVEKISGALVYSGSVARSGEAIGVVVAIGLATKFGQAAHLVTLSAPKLHAEAVTFRVVLLLLIVGAGLVLIGIIVLVAVESTPDHASTRPTFVANIPLFLSLLVSAVPVALPALFSLTMALGSMELAKNHVLVTRLNAAEDAASMDVLCTDKTGTLTKNELAVVGTFAFPPNTENDILRFGLYASRTENFDVIDGAIASACKGKGITQCSKVLEFHPFSAKTRKTMAKVELADSSVVEASKGAVATLLEDCHATPEVVSTLDAKVEEGAKSGFRSIGVASGLNFMGIIFLADPPRDDSQEVLEAMRGLGVRVLILTGDNIHIASGIAKQVGLGDDIRKYKSKDKVDDSVTGFAEIFPEDKHEIVLQLQKQNHIVGMTGDGVNDAPALKQAEVGVAMSNATDVAKASASAIFLNAGLSSMPWIVSIGRQVHARIETWILNKICRTIFTIGFVVLMFLVRRQWVIDPLNMIEQIFLFDFVTLCLSTDNAAVVPKPCVWRIIRLAVISSVLGVMLIGEAVALYYLFISVFDPTFATNLPLQHTFCFQILLFFSLANTFIVRERKGFFFKSRPSWTLLIVVAVDVAVALVLCSVGVDALALSRLPFQFSCLVIGWSLLFPLLLNDLVKYCLLRILKVQ
jgi:H+-transporting ATPase